jgi:C1A family cysteine protease
MERLMIVRTIFWRNTALFAALVLAGPASAQQTGTQAEILKQRELNAPAEIKTTLGAMRAEITEKKLTHGVGFTKIMEQPRNTRLGDVDDPKQTKEWRQNINQQAERLLKVDEEDRVGFVMQDPGRRNTLPDIVQQKTINCNASLRSFDWRAYNKVSPVRHQTCGNCWAFAAVAAYEASYLIRNNLTEDGSEQYLNDCGKADDGSRAGGCDGGLATNALQHMVREGDAKEAASPNEGLDRPCLNPTVSLKAVAWGFVDPSVDFPSRQKIKAALCAHGPLTTRMRIVSDQIFAYTTGVYNEKVASDTDGGGHAVVIVGWDDAKNAWLIKNSWNTDWGPEQGYGWIGYNSNRIGRHTAWITAQSSYYTSQNFNEVKQTILRGLPVPAELRPSKAIDKDGGGQSLPMKK